MKKGKIIIIFTILFILPLVIMFTVNGVSRCNFERELESIEREKEEKKKKEQQAEEAIRANYVATSSLVFGKNVNIDSFVQYFENRLNDNNFPRVKKYNKNSATNQEKLILETYDATYCYLYYDGRNLNGNLLWQSKVYVLPELKLFIVEKTNYQYDSLANGLVGLNDCWSASISFKLGNIVDNSNFTGSYTHEGFSDRASSYAFYKLNFLYNIKSLILPTGLPLFKDVKYSYEFGQTTDIKKAKEHATISETGERVYSCLNSCLSFCQTLFTEVNNSYNLLSKT